MKLQFAADALLPVDHVRCIEILGAMLEEACLKKWIIFSADLHPILLR
jgi:hypothetical protein